MVTLDKIKIKAPIDCIEEDGKRSFKLTHPYLVKIGSSTKFRNWIFITFTSKILLDDYPDFINRDNIRLCLEKVKEISNINFNIDRVMSEGVVTSCDFTVDVPITRLEGLYGDLKKLKTLLPLCNKNNQEYPCSAYKNGSISVQRAVSSDKSKLRITIYDKPYELRRRCNADFRSCLQNEEVFMNHFAGKVRIEINAYTTVQIKRWLNIADTRIHTVVNATENPIKNAIEEVFVPVNVSDMRITQTMQEKISVLKHYNWDMAAVEANVREHEGNNWGRKMPKYRELNLQFNPELNQIRQVNIANWV